MNTAIVHANGIGAGDPKALSTLEVLQQKIAALREQSDARKAAGDMISPSADMRMARVVDVPPSVKDRMWFDRDVKKHAEQVIKMLRERGGLRLLGAVGSPDLADMISHLYESPTNFSPAVNYVLGEEALARQRNDALSDLRLLLYGGTGVGKTDFALSLAKLLGVPAEVLSLSAAQAAASLAGSEQHWSNTQPGIVWKQLIQDMHANPHDSWALSPGGLGARHFWRTFDYLLAEGRLQCIGKAAIGEASA